MTDLTIAIRLNADGSGLSAGLKPVKADIDALKGSAKDAGTAFVKMGKDGEAAGSGLQSIVTRNQDVKRSLNEILASSNSNSAAFSAANRKRLAELDAEIAKIRQARDAAKASDGGLSFSAGKAFNAAEGQARSNAGADIDNLIVKFRSGETAAAGLAGAARAAVSDVTALGGGASGAAAQIAALSGAGEGASVALAALASPAGIAVAAVAALTAVFVGGYLVADGYSDRVKALSNVIAQAGAISSISAASLSADAATIAATTGQSYDAIIAASQKLIATTQFTGEEVGQLSARGAALAATFGIDVGAATDKVATAFNALGNGDVKALDQGFGFLDANVRRNIISLAESGRTADAQKTYMDALSGSLHGGNGSLSDAFGNLTSATGDWIGKLLSSLTSIQIVKLAMQGLGTVANAAALAIRNATNPTPDGPRATATVKAEFVQAAARAGTSKALLKRGGLGFQTASVQAGFDERSGEARRLALELTKAVARDRLAQKEVLDQRAARTRFDQTLAAGPAGAKYKNDLVAGRKLAKEAGIKGATELDRAAGDYADKQIKAAGALKEQVGHARSLGAATRANAKASGDAAKSNDKAQRDAAREAERGAKELASNLAAIIREFDPGAALLDRYTATLDKINQLSAAGKLDFGQEASIRIAAANGNAADRAKLDAATARKFYDDLGNVDIEADYKDFTEQATKAGAVLEDGARKAGDAFGESGIDAALAIADALGLNLNSTLGKLIQAANPNGVGDGAFGSAFKKGREEFNSEIVKGLSDVGKKFGKSFKAVFGEKFTGQLGEAAGAAIEGAKFGKSVTNALGIKGSKTGAAIGAGIGSFFPQIPFAKQIGAVIGSVVGGLFKKSPTAAASLSSVDGPATFSGKNGSQLSGAASSVQSGIQAIIDQLGGSAGSFKVSIGKYKDSFRVDGNGGSSVGNKRPGGAIIYDGKDEAAATSAAILNALQDGAVQGLSAKVAQALRSSSDLTTALNDALKVQSIEDLLAGFGGTARKTFIDFERQAKERLRIAGKYGFDLVALEAQNGKERAALLTATISQATGSLKDLLESLASGEKFGGTANERRAALIAKADGLRATAATDPATANKLADVLDQLYSVSLDAYGSAGAAFSSDRNLIASTAQSIIDQATAEITAADEKARVTAGTDQKSTDALIAQSNTLLIDIGASLDDNYAQNTQIIAALKALGVSGIGGNSLGGSLNIGAGLV